MNYQLLEQIEKEIESLARDFSLAKEYVLEKEQTLLDNVASALEEDISVKELWTQAISPAMVMIGDWFHKDEIFVPEIIAITRTIKKIMTLVRKKYPIGEPEYKDCPIVIGTVQYDIHDIGKNLVKYMLEIEGFPVFDLKFNVTPIAFAEKAREESARVVAVSCLLTTTLPGIASVTKTIKEQGLHETVKVIAGGAPMTEAKALEMGANSYGKDAWEAVIKIKELLGLNR